MCQLYKFLFYNNLRPTIIFKMCENEQLAYVTGTNIGMCLQSKTFKIAPPGLKSPGYTSRPLTAFFQHGSIKQWQGNVKK